MSIMNSAQDMLEVEKYLPVPTPHAIYPKIPQKLYGFNISSEISQCSPNYIAKPCLKTSNYLMCYRLIFTSFMCLIFPSFYHL